MGRAGFVSGREGDFAWVVMDARHYSMTVLECSELGGLGKTIDRMLNKPDAVINGPFFSSYFGVATQGQVIREGRLEHANPQRKRFYVAQMERQTGQASFRFGSGDPQTVSNARAAFGGLGPLLINGAPPSGPLTPWAQSIYDEPVRTGRGAVALDRKRGLILLIVQENSGGREDSNAMTMTALREWLNKRGITDAVFNDGSNSESLFAGEKWLIKPAWFKDWAMDFAIGFVDHRKVRRVRYLVMDGTKTGDGAAFAKALNRVPITQFAPANMLEARGASFALAPLKRLAGEGVLKYWQGTDSNVAHATSRLLQKGGDDQADLLYLSSHAWRHGDLWYHPNDQVSRGQLTIANPWSQNFKPQWTERPRWLIIAGCATLGLRVSRCLLLDKDNERAHLRKFHQEIHGPKSSPPGLTDKKKVALVRYHPGWIWHDRIFSKSGLRGVLGYWHRSPGPNVGDVEIIADFASQLRQGKSFLAAWRSANRYLPKASFSSATWAAMIRDGCAEDTLATLESVDLPRNRNPFLYYDGLQSGTSVLSAYRKANTSDDSEKFGDVTVPTNRYYDRHAVDDRDDDVKIEITASNFLVYDDDVGP